MKRILSTVLASVILISAIVAVPVSADYRSDEWGYTVSGGKATINRYYGEDTEVIIPSDIDDYPVTGLSYWTDSDKHGIFEGTPTTNVIIADGVTVIGDYAFVNCTSLENVEIFDSVTKIGTSAFANCTSLENISFPDCVTTIGNSAFSGCESLESVTIPDSVTSIGSGAFAGCIRLFEITLPFPGDKRHTASDTYQYPFGYIFGTSSYTNSAATTQNYYGSSTSETTSTTYYIPVTLKKVTLTDCSYIPYGAFYDCDNLMSVTISENTVTAIGDYAFYSCGLIENMTIPEGVTSIGQSAFFECIMLKNVTIADSVTSIGSYAFDSTMYYNKATNWEDGVLYISNHLIKAKPSVSDSYSIKPGTLTLADEAFAYCRSLTSVTIPGSVTTIGSGAFFNCTSLESATIPDSVTSLGSSAFYYCTSLESVTIGDGVTTIGGYTFSNCTALASVTIGDSVTTIGEFAFRGCNSLATVNYPGTQSQWSAISVGYGNDAFLNANIIFTVYPIVEWDYTVSDGKVTINRYFGTSPSVTIPSTIEGYPVAELSCWKDDNVNRGIFDGKPTKSVTIPDSVTTIGEYAFYGCTSLTTVIIGDGVTTIGNYAFRSCTSLTSVTIGDGVTTIGSGAFQICDSLESLTIGKSVSIIANYAFIYCPLLTNIYVDPANTTYKSFDGVVYSKNGSALIICPCGKTSVSIPSGVTKIEWYAFNNCSKLTRVTFPSAVTTIGNYAFKSCTSLESVIIGEHVTTIGEEAFRGCTSLASVTIPDGVRTISYGAFRDCNSLTTVYYTGTESQWSEISIGRYNDPIRNANVVFNYTFPVVVLYGDANGDGVVDLRDATRLAQYANDDTVEIFDGADANGDGVVDLRDATRIAQYANDDTVHLGPAA